MLLRTDAELAATGAVLMFWFHGLLTGNSCWPSSVGTVRSSSSSRRGVVRRTVRFRDPAAANQCRKRASKVNMEVPLLERAAVEWRPAFGGDGMVRVHYAHGNKRGCPDKQA